MQKIREIQIGKNGVTANFLESLKQQFNNCNNVKIKVLKNFCRNKEELNKISEEILNHLGKRYTAKNIGYTINIKRWRKEVRE